jgi:sugar lactone lactonase YvrE
VADAAAAVAQRQLPANAGGCCLALAWTADDKLLAVDIEDGVGWDVTRYDTTGRSLGQLGTVDRPNRITVAPDGTIYVLDNLWHSRIKRFESNGSPAGEVFLPEDRDLMIMDLATAPDGTLWLVDHQHGHVFHVDPDGQWLGDWSYYPALRSPGDGGYRIAVAPDGLAVYVLSWTRVLRFAPDGRLLAAWGAASPLDRGPFESPLDLKVDSRGRVYVLEGTGRVQVFEPDGRRLATWPAFDTAPQPAVLRGALAIGTTGRIAVSDQAAELVHIYHALSAAPFSPTARLHLPRVVAP